MTTIETKAETEVVPWKQSACILCESNCGVEIRLGAATCELDADLVHRTARRIATASSVALFEDLGVQMSLNSTLCSNLDKLLWLLTGNFGIEGGRCVPTALNGPSGRGGSGGGGSKPGRSRRSPVVDAPIIAGWVPCNTIAEEILTDLPDRYDADVVGLSEGDRARLTTKRGTARVVVEISSMMRAGHISLPIGYGVTEQPGDEPVGVAPHKVTSNDHCDPIAGTRYHKHVPARLERLERQEIPV